MSWQDAQGRERCHLKAGSGETGPQPRLPCAYLIISISEQVRYKSLQFFFLLFAQWFSGSSPKSLPTTLWQVIDIAGFCATEVRMLNFGRFLITIYTLDRGSSASQSPNGTNPSGGRPVLATILPICFSTHHNLQQLAQKLGCQRKFTGVASVAPALLSLLVSEIKLTMSSHQIKKDKYQPDTNHKNRMLEKIN